MIENAISSNSLYSPCSTLNYSQAAMMGLTGSHGSLQDSQQLNYSSHSNIPNIILIGNSGPGMPSLQALGAPGPVVLVAEGRACPAPHLGHLGRSEAVGVPRVGIQG